MKGAVHGVAMVFEGHAGEFCVVAVEGDVCGACCDVSRVVPEKALFEKVGEGFEVCGGEGLFALLPLAAGRVLLVAVIGGGIPLFGWRAAFGDAFCVDVHDFLEFLDHRYADGFMANFGYVRGHEVFVGRGGARLGFEAWFVLVGVGRHERLDGDEDRFEALC